MSKLRISIMVIAVLCLGISYTRNRYENPDAFMKHAVSIVDNETQRVFQDIYTHSIWGQQGDGSGIGSEPSHTKNTINILQTVVDEYRIASMVDLPCGGIKWTQIALRRIQDKQPDFKYLGADIVGTVISKNKQEFANTSWQFMVFDFTENEVPAGFELIFSRDALQHLPLHLAVSALEKFATSAASYLLIGSYESEDGNTAMNRNVAIGEYFSINLLQQPFNLPEPLARYSEGRYDGEPEKHLYLYRIADLGKVDFASMMAIATNHVN